MSVETGGQSDDDDVRLPSLMRKQSSLLQPTTARFPLKAHVRLKKKVSSTGGKKADFSPPTACPQNLHISKGTGLMGVLFFVRVSPLVSNPPVKASPLVQRMQESSE